MAAALSLGRLAVSTVAAGCVNTIRRSLFVLSSTVQKKENGKSRIDEEESERLVVEALCSKLLTRLLICNLYDLDRQNKEPA